MNNYLFPFNWASYFLRSKGRHGIHSPFVYELYDKVIVSHRIYYDFAPLEFLRQKLLTSTSLINTVDYGASGYRSETKKIKDIARKSSIATRKGRLLFRLVNFFQPETILELGTSLGLSTLYLAKGNVSGKIITIEGSPETAAFALKNFKLLKADNIEQVTGDFNSVLPGVLKRIKKIDFVFFDGNHKKEATLDYFHQCLSLAGDNSVFVFDDIRWSKGMLEAWKELVNDKKVTLSIDLFTMGLVFFYSGMEKQHFILRF